MLMDALRQMLRRVLAALGALHPRPRRRPPGSDELAPPGEVVAIRVATFDAALFSMAPAMPPETGGESGAGAESDGPRPKGILKARVFMDVQEPEMSSPSVSSMRSRRQPQRSVAEVLMDVQEPEISPGRSMRRRRQPQRSVAEVLRGTGADIIGLQNVRAEEESGMRPLSELAAALGMRYVFAESWAPGYGNAVLSRWPIKRWKAVRVPDHSDVRNVLRATIEVPTAGELSFHCTHLDHLEESWRMKQVESMLRSADGPHILTGGLNALDGADYSAHRWADIVKYYEEIGKPTPKTEVMEYLKGKNFADAKDFAREWENVVVRAKGQDVQGTCKYGTRVDYILASPDFPYKFVPGSYTVVSSKGTSDHHIVMVDVMISPASPDSAVPTTSRATSSALNQLAETTWPVTSTGAPEVVPPPEETPATTGVEPVMTNVNPATHQSAPAADEEMAPAGTTAAQESTSVAPPYGSTANPEHIIETAMLEVATDSSVLQTNTLEGDTTASTLDSICMEIAPYTGDKEKGADSVATTSTPASAQPISSSSFNLLRKLRGEEVGRRKSLDELLHRIEQAHKRELDATQLEISQLKEKLELEQRKSEHEITSAKLKALKSEEAMTNQVRRVVYLESELQDAKEQIAEYKIKMSELSEAIDAAQKVHDQVMDQLNKTEADAAKYAQSKVEELEALKISSAESQRLKDEEIQKLTQAHMQLVGLIGLVTWDLFGSESNLLTQPPGIQLMKIREFAPRVKVGVLEVFLSLMPEKELPTSIAEFLRRLSKIPDYVTHWKESAARAGASRALSLAKAHHPDLNIDVISAGKPEKHEDGRPFTAEDYSTIEKSLRGFATRLCSSVNLDKFFHHYQLDGSRTKATPTSSAATAPSTPTPTAATTTREADDPRRF